MWRSVAALAFGTLLSVGCAGSVNDPGKTGEGDGGGVASGASAVQPYIDALCGLARTCCGRAGLPAAPLADCEAEVLRQTDVLQAVLDGTVNVDPAKLAACAAAIRGNETSCLFDKTDIRTACSPIFSGTLGEGESCRKADECIRGAEPVMCLKISMGNSSPETGVCRAMTRGTAGVPCSVSADDQFYGITSTTPDPNLPLAYCTSADGLHCSLPDRVCTPLAAEGAACNELDCEPGFYCDVTCRRTKAAGSPCATFDECGGILGCIDGTCAPAPVASDKLCSGDYN